MPNSERSRSIATNEARLLAAQVMERADSLGAISDEPGILTRRYGTEAMKRANDAVSGWMRDAGMSVRTDAIGNLQGLYDGSRPAIVVGEMDPPTLVLGSHLDTVRDAGKYDGPLGVLVAIASIARLNAQGRRLPFDVQVVGFADEEGLRFHTAYLGSKAYAGTFDPDYLALSDPEGVSLADAIRAFGGAPDVLLDGRSAPAKLLGYCEVHIEQGPVLEREDLPVGIVSAISGQSRVGVRLRGEAGHAGTVPMTMRKDALCAAAEIIISVEALASAVQGMVVTVGQISAHPGASNVIPGEVSLSLDVRHIEDGLREEACKRMQQSAAEICERRDISLSWDIVQETGSVGCQAGLAAELARAVQGCGCPAHFLPSGAGHDAVTMSLITPIAMLFVRCRAGISHNPAESVQVQDVAVAIDVLGSFLEKLGEREAAEKPNNDS